MRQRICTLIVAALCGAAAAATAQTTPQTAPQAGPQAPGQASNSDAARLLSDFQNFGPHRAFVVSPDGRASWWAGVSGPDPGPAIASALKRCLERTKQDCKLHIVNNYTVTGHDWRELVPARAVGAVDIGRLRPQPYWSMRGPQLASGLLVWSHGYMAGRNSTESPPQSWVGHFTHLGYDLYRFDREWIADWASDATALADAVARAKAMGYRRVILAGQSAGAWVSLAALQRGAAADGVISIAAAHHGTVEKMRDQTRARSEWQRLLEGIKRGPRLIVVNFADDAYDVGGRMDDARSILARNGVDAEIIDAPEGFKGHGAADSTFSRKFGACFAAFIEKGKRQAPC
ncbi:MAG: alpha/beta hydrolase [Rhodospirillales bacterium]|nr:alpha/beta hydrolase [Rhodospirillales bacterium]